jgi:hypothetical protein
MVPDRFTTFFTPGNTDECWEWQGSRFINGYGRLYVNGVAFYAHRLAHEHFVGPIPNGLVIDHLCRNKLCVNPTHLETVTSGENTIRGMHPNMVTHREKRCRRGHEIVGYNALLNATNGRKQCRRCRDDAQRRRRAA